VRTAAAIAVLLAQSGEFGLILFAYAFQSELLEDALYQQLLLVVVLSMLVTPFLAYLAQRLALSDKQPAADHDEASNDKPPVVLAGFGRVGRRIGEILTSAGVQYVAIDHDSTRVLRERANGHAVYYGDGRKLDVLRSVGAADANLVIVSINDFEATEAIVAALNRAHPGVTILARGHDAEQCRVLQQLGAGRVVSENLEASLDLAREALIHELADSHQTEVLLGQFRERYYADMQDSLNQPSS
ncbi:MAG: potassium transporter KefC, partial [Gammaproteobacteria bacterium]|nr:potassium transporter KefC [Gammaproteobacteria bacterium]